MPRRVVITGLGAISPFGVGIEPLWQAMLEGRSAIGPIRAFDPGGLHCQIAGEVPDGFTVRDFVPKSYRKATKVMARDTQLAVGAATSAVGDAGIITRATAEEGQQTTYPPPRVGCQIGAGLIVAEINELTAALYTARDEQGKFSYERWGDTGMDNLTPLWMLKYLPNMLACHVTILHDARGPSNTLTCSEASGLLCVGESRAVIERGHADACFSGSAESKINPLGLIRFEYGGRLGKFDASFDGASAVRPFDPDAPGGVPGEGSGIVIVEARDTAEARGARIYAEIVGFAGGQSSTRGDVANRAIGLQNAIGNALRDARLEPADIDAILPTALGVPMLDAMEATALRSVFGPGLSEIQMITVTPHIGNTLAGYGGLALGVAAKALYHQTLPARLNAGTPAEDLRAEAVPTRDAPIRHVLLTTHALGGQNAAMILRAA